jgi:hypothetical protein
MQLALHVHDPVLQQLQHPPPPFAVQPSVIIQVTKASIQTISNTKQQQTN